MQKFINALLVLIVILESIGRFVRQVGLGAKKTFIVVLTIADILWSSVYVNGAVVVVCVYIASALQERAINLNTPASEASLDIALLAMTLCVAALFLWAMLHHARPKSTVAENETY